MATVALLSMFSWRFWKFVGARDLESEGETTGPQPFVVKDCVDDLQQLQWRDALFPYDVKESERSFSPPPHTLANSSCQSKSTSAQCTRPRRKREAAKTSGLGVQDELNQSPPTYPGLCDPPTSWDTGAPT